MTLAGLHPVRAAIALAAARTAPPKGLTGVLPGELAEPLHFPNPGLARWPILALLAFAVAWALYRRWRARPPAAAEPAAPDPKPRPERTGLALALYELRERTLSDGKFREGCHHLAALLTTHFERVGFGSRERLPCTRMTAREIRSAVGRTAASRLLVRLSDLRFGRSEPAHSDFEQVCRRAQKVTGAKARVGGGEVSEEADDDE